MVPNFIFSVNEGLDSSFLPNQTDPTATGYDVRSSKNYELIPYQYNLIDLGIRAIIPDGWWLQLNARSSSFAKIHLHYLTGIIDQSYTGQIKFACQWIPDSQNLKELADTGHLKINKGDRIGQLVPYRLEKMNVELVSETQFDILAKERVAIRNPAGFGTTGKQ